MPAAIYQSECAAQAGCAGDDFAVGAGGPLALCHISALRVDGVNPGLLGIDEGGQRGLGAPRLIGHERRMKPAPGCRNNLQASYEPLLEEAWASDMDSTVKPVWAKYSKSLNSQGLALSLDQSGPTFFS